MRAIGVFPAACAAAAVVLAALPGPFPLGAAEELHVEGLITRFIARDMDGDGRAEVWVAYHEPLAAGGRRLLGLFRARSGGGSLYARVPDQVIPVDRRAVLFALGDYASAPGVELAFLSRTSCVLHPLSGESPRRLFETDLFFTMAAAEALPAWLSKRALDIDGDGLEDWVLPERSRLRLLFQGRGDAGAGEAGGAAESAWSEAGLPIEHYFLLQGDAERIQAAVDEFAETGAGGGAFVNVTGSYPFPALVDFDGDGRLDVAVKQRGYRLEVFLQRAARVFPSSPDLAVEIPWAREATSLELRDVDGDGRCDAVASALLLEKLATRLLVFIQDPQAEGHGFVAPRQELRVEGLFRAPEIADADGDGRPDLLVSAYRLDLFDRLKERAIEEVEITHQVFPGEGTTAPFARRPAYRRVFLLKTRGLQREARRPFLHAGRDLTGDSRADILFIDSEETLRLYAGIAGGSLRFEEEAAFSERIAEPLEVVLQELDGRAGEDVVLRYERFLAVRAWGGRG